jgi:two-component system KDP operon response regulator KdpE
VLLIEDDDRVAEALIGSLQRRGYEVVPARDGRTGLREAITQRPDVVLLDLGLPDMDGITLLRKLRGASDVPVIVVTARGTVDDIARGLDIGADDYLVKPFDLGELVARMRRAMRRAAPAEEVYDDGVLRVDFRLSEVSVGGVEATFSPRELRLLEILVRSAGSVQSIDAIVAHVWGDSGMTAHLRRNLAVVMAMLRSKLAAAGLDPTAIVTAHGLGYYYQPPNRPTRPASGPRIGYSHAERLLNPPDKQAPGRLDVPG